ncbi:MAG: hypothetical protein E6Z53_02560 [Pantoea sp.]|uniref:hypothetical protein n=1 Tax=Pantoea sp. TaxID=69393 RepID=UPI0029145786|nr:hypothetical protein [Pantoea sp.]MDU5473792.1 hypothetical protein [Pantoea sp.]MDU5835935.1 hypothetical protein [Pantoea sp.]
MSQLRTNTLQTLDNVVTINIEDIADIAYVDNVPTPVIPTDTFLFSNFRSDNDVSVYFSTSNDGYNFKTISDQQMKVSGSSDKVTGRDPSQLWYNGKCYIGVTIMVAGSYDTTIYSSTDGKVWDKHQVIFGSSPVSSNTNPAPGATHACNQIWAPYLFMDGGKMYCAVTLPFGSDFADINGNTIPDFRQYIAECTDIDNLTFSAPTLIQQVGNTRSQIDGVIHNINGTWFMFTKNDYSKQIEQWASSSVKGPYTKVGNVITSRQCEAPTLVKREGFKPEYILYADDYVNGEFIYSESDDLATWSAIGSITSDRNTRHGAIINAGSLDKKSQKIINSMLASSTTNQQRIVEITADNASFSPRDGYTYYITGTTGRTLTITELGCKEFYVWIGSLSPTATITFPVSSCFDGVYPGSSLVLNGIDHGNKLVKFRRLGNKFICDAYTRPVGSQIALSAVSGFPTISLLSPNVGSVYVTDGSATYTAATTLGGVSANYPDGAYFYLQCRASSGTNGTINIALDATNMATGAVTIAPGDERTIEVRKVAGLWRVLG